MDVAKIAKVDAWNFMLRKMVEVAVVRCHQNQGSEEQRADEVEEEIDFCYPQLAVLSWIMSVVS